MSAITPMTTRMVVITGTSLTKVSLVQRIRREHEPAAEGEADEQEQRRAEHALAERRQDRSCRAAPGRR